jgi:hypothetical protein
MIVMVFHGSAPPSQPGEPAVLTMQSAAIIVDLPPLAALENLHRLDAGAIYVCMICRPSQPLVVCRPLCTALRECVDLSPSPSR